RQECARVRAGLVTAIHADPDTAAPKWGNTRPGSDGSAVYRERYLELQRTMQAETGRLRGQLRERLGRASAELARLAEVDAVMEATLSPRELTLLATVPILLGHHFERLRADAEAPQANLEFPPDPGGAGADTWLDVFRRDMRNVLLAELAVRFHPVEGLLAALRTAERRPHAQNPASPRRVPGRPGRRVLDRRQLSWLQPPGGHHHRGDRRLLRRRRAGAASLPPGHRHAGPGGRGGGRGHDGTR